MKNKKITDKELKKLIVDVIILQSALQSGAVSLMTNKQFEKLMELTK